MRIAQIAPLYERVPPERYGGTERVVFFLTEQLIKLGHDVTLFASGDSVTSARLVAAARRSLRTDPTCVDTFAAHVLQLEQVLQQAAKFDVLHFHTGFMHYPVVRRLSTPHVTTLHGRLDIVDLCGVFNEFRDAPVISISQAQRQPFPDINWAGTVHHGLPPNAFTPGGGRGDYLLFLGRISPEKRPDRAIEIARRTGRPLLIAAKVDKVDRDYFEAIVKPHIDGRQIQFIGEVNDPEKQALLGDAYAFVFPIDWPEPFGIVVIEAMACGTPIVAWRHGSLPELVRDCETGFLVDSIDAAVAAVERVDEISRAACRQAFEERFTDRRMALDYLAIYKRMIERKARSTTEAA